ncbi:hypothetical protein BDP81DRAFT_504811, partial [Colletotrichum phormii]
ELVFCASNANGIQSSPPPLIRAILQKEEWSPYPVMYLPQRDQMTSRMERPRERRLYTPSRATRSIGFPTRIVRANVDELQRQATEMLSEGLEDNYGELQEAFRQKTDTSAPLISKKSVLYVIQRHVFYPVLNVLNIAMKTTVGGKVIWPRFGPEVQTMEVFNNSDEGTTTVIGLYDVKDPEAIRVKLFPYFGKNEGEDLLQDTEDNTPNDQDISLAEIAAENVEVEEEEEEDEDDDDDDSSSDDDENDPELRNEEVRDCFIENTKTPTPDGGNLPTALAYLAQEAAAHAALTGLPEVTIGNECAQILMQFPEMARESTTMARFDAGPGVMRVVASEKRGEFCLNFLGSLLRVLNQIRKLLHSIVNGHDSSILTKRQVDSFRGDGRVGLRIFHALCWIAL